MPQHRSKNGCNGQAIIFIRPYHIREEDKKVIDKELKHLYYLGILREVFSQYSIPFKLISKEINARQKSSGGL